MCVCVFATRATFSIYFGSCIFQSTNGKLFLFSLSPTLRVSLSVIYLSLPRHYSRSLPSYRLVVGVSESSLWCLGVRVMYDRDCQWNWDRVQGELDWDCISSPTASRKDGTGESRALTEPNSIELRPTMAVIPIVQLYKY